MFGQTFKKISIAILFFLGVGLYFENSVQGQAEAQLKAQMQRKLENTKQLMAGLALDDGARIEQGTKGLLSTCEALGWTGPGKAEFEARDKAFHTAVKRLSKFVEAKNYDGARLQFVDMVVLCMDCHSLGKEK